MNKKLEKYIERQKIIKKKRRKFSHKFPKNAEYEDICNILETDILMDLI